MKRPLGISCEESKLQHFIWNNDVDLYTKGYVMGALDALKWVKLNYNSKSPSKEAKDILRALKEKQI